ncbi:hypothetical protein [Streptomyces sp. NPDC051567]|uniref:hypothetical protein n=1 Tax=Streptomyces sp. NPDC051567 TaxID=3365660 RepID=UPI00379BFE94
MLAAGPSARKGDQWIDSEGRTLRFEQRMDLRGTPSADKVVFGDFGPAETFTAPTGG